jgi:type IX secretion system PorP/SprF family membrane protein
MRNFLFFGMIYANLSAVFGQQDEQISLYQYNTLSYNSAYAGMQGKLSATALSRFQWIQFSGAPTTQLLSVHSSLAKNHLGIGGNLKHDQIGNRSRTEIDLNLASIVHLNARNDQLRLGISLGLNHYEFDFSGALMNDLGDPLATQLMLTQFTAGFGLYNSGEKHFIGFSIPHLIPNKSLSNQLLSAFSTPHFYLTGGYEFKVKNQLKLKTSTLVKYVRHVPLTIDASATIIYREKLYGGIGYRLHEGIGVNALFQLKQYILIGYSYEFPINGLLKHQSGSHEVMLQYVFKEKKETDGIPKF